MKWLKQKIEQIRFQNKLRGMDFIWYFTGGYSWDIFPPSYYYLYPREELDRERERFIKELEALVTKNKTPGKPEEGTE